jgi:hypothetical protein
MINNKAQPSQITNQKKYFVSPTQSLVCFAAGGGMARDMALQIIHDCDPVLKLNGASESQWEAAVHRVAVTAIMPYLQPVDEILIARADVTDAFWLVSRRLVSQQQQLIFASVQKMGQHFCTGDNAVAQFLPRHLWSLDLSVSDLRKLALLTLSYAAQEEPASVGPPFDIMTLDKTGRMFWSEQGPMHAKFQSEIERLFMQYSDTGQF